MENEPYETRRFETRKAFFVLESLSFRNLKNSTNLNCKLSNSCGFDSGDEDVDALTDTRIKLQEHLPHNGKNTQTENSINVSSTTTASNSIAALRPHFILESLAFTARNKVNTYNIESYVANNCNTGSRSIRNKAAVIPPKGTSISCDGDSKKYLPKGRHFYVLESLTYNECGILRITSKNINETSYNIHIGNVAVSKQTNQSGSIIPTNINEPPTTSTNVPKAKYKKTQNRKGPYSGLSGLNNRNSNLHCRLNLSRMVKSKDFTLCCKEQDEINRYLLLENDPVRIKMLKTIRQPYVLLERLSE